ncbi:Phosphatidate cytidylyltransferase [Penicillium sp. IBT 16267x]|nr:Phosphatidate cytidylyltransferase [Penicillium sp. IBT 16267x]
MRSAMIPRGSTPSALCRAHLRSSALPRLPASVRCFAIDSRSTLDSPLIRSANASPSKSPLLYNVPSQVSSSASFSTSPSLSDPDWDYNPNLQISNFSELPSKDFGVNQHMIINQEFKEALRQILWQFRAPIRYAFAYGSGVFAQDGSAASATPTHPSAPAAIKNMQQGPGKMIDFIFGVSYSQHWHALNLSQHRDHYSGLGSLGSYAVSQVQDRFGAGVYFNTHVTVSGTLIKYGVVNLDTLCRDLTRWDTLYLAGRLQKPVKILRDHPKVRLANQMNLLSALRVALLLLPERFSEFELYSTIAGISYMGDLRMVLRAEDPGKIHAAAKMIGSTTQMPSWEWRRIWTRSGAETWYAVFLTHSAISFTSNTKAAMQFPGAEFDKMMAENNSTQDIVRRPQGGPFERRIASDEKLQEEVSASIMKTIRWPSTIQTIKGPLTAGPCKTWNYIKEKREKHRKSQAVARAAATNSDTKTD